MRILGAVLAAGLVLAGAAEALACDKGIQQQQTSGKSFQGGKKGGMGLVGGNNGVNRNNLRRISNNNRNNGLNVRRVSNNNGGNGNTLRAR
jgi:hypothetical protein